jgi:hypothetical protein
MALDLSGPQVVAGQFSASYIKNCDLHNSLNKVETIALNQFSSLKNLTGQQSIVFSALFALAFCSFF